VDQVSPEPDSTLRSNAWRDALPPALAAVTALDVLLLHPLLHRASATDWTGAAATAAETLEPVALAARCVLLAVLIGGFLNQMPMRWRAERWSAGLLVLAAVCAAAESILMTAPWLVRSSVTGSVALFLFCSRNTWMTSGAVLCVAARQILGGLAPMSEGINALNDLLILGAFALVGLGSNRWNKLVPWAVASVAAGVGHLFPQLTSTWMRFAPFEWQVVPMPLGIFAATWALSMGFCGVHTRKLWPSTAMLLLCVGGTDGVDLATCACALFLTRFSAHSAQSSGGTSEEPASEDASGGSSPSL
jgi:hypothetical protein